MTADDHLNPQQFSRAQLGSRWQNGECGTYACALQQMRPSLKIGVVGELDDDDDTFHAAHFFAHDDEHAYDSLGMHKMPYSGVRGQFNQVYANENPHHWGLVEDEHGAADGPEALRAIRQAQQHARRHNVLGF